MLLREDVRDAAEDLEAADAADRFVGIREMESDVALADGAERGVGDGVAERVGVGVAVQAGVVAGSRRRRG